MISGMVMSMLFGLALLGTTAGMLGVFVLLRGQSLLGDALSHAVLPGVAALFLWTHSKNPFLLLSGGMASGMLGAFLVYIMTTRTKIKYDTALGVVLSVFFGLGLVLITLIQKLPLPHQAVLSTFLFGNAATLLYQDIVALAVFSLVLALCGFAFWRKFSCVTFDPLFAQSMGIPVRIYDGMFTGLLITMITLSLQTVGVVLMSSLLIAPAVAARHWVTRLEGMVLLSGCFGMTCSIGGAFASSMVDQLPTGPAIVIMTSILVAASIIYACIYPTRTV
jgi:manganese/zinc/iron transport system permease protein